MLLICGTIMELFVELGFTHKHTQNRYTDRNVDKKSKRRKYQR
jgi:hypothetical protein